MLSDVDVGWEKHRWKKWKQQEKPQRSIQTETTNGTRDNDDEPCE
jgi:hypothetical protein